MASSNKGMISIEVTNLEDVDNLVNALSKKIPQDIAKGFDKYVRQHLVARMKQRLQNATQPLASSELKKDMSKGNVGGYGLPENPPKYAEWKQSQSNLPLKGNVSPRTLVATGHFLDSIDVTHFVSRGNDFSYSVGPRAGMRPGTTPFKSVKDNDSAELKMVENLDVAEWIEDSKYAFLAKEYEDVTKDVIPLVTAILQTTIKELITEYIKNTKELFPSSKV